MIAEGLSLKGRVCVEKNGVLLVDKPNLVVTGGQEWVAARFRDDFDESLTTNGVGNLNNGQIQFMSVGTGLNAGDASLVDVDGAAYPAGYGVYDDPTVAANFTPPAVGDVSLENEVDRVEMGVSGAMASSAPTFGGEVSANQVKFVAEFHPSTRFGTEVKIDEGQFQPLCEAGLHNTGLAISGSGDYLDGRGSAGDVSYAPDADDRMIARVTFPTISKGPLDLIRITWTITVGA